MQLSHPARRRYRNTQGMLVLLLLSSSLLLSACGGDPRVRQEADSARARFEQMLQHAQQIGVPSASLQDIFRQRQQLLTSNAPSNLFGLPNDQTTDDYYHNLATRYTQLMSQIQTIITSSTVRAQEQALQDLQSLQHALQQAQSQNVPVQKLSEELAQAQVAVPQAKDPLDYQQISEKIHDIQQSLALFDGLYTQAQNLIQKFHDDAQSWGNTYAYYDPYDGQSYPLNAGYQDQGIGSDLNAELAQASSVDDLRNVISDTNNAQFDLQLLKNDYHDSTPYDEMHQTDREALDRYQLQKGQVMIVSMVEQALRLYQDGQLVRAFQVTTGRYERPSLPGLWSVLDRQSPTVFRSSDPPNSPYWYPPTPIHYAMLYHEGGYFIHDSWWRDTYGSGTQFPHADASGNQSFAGNGSHGCINVQENQAAWLYNNTSWGTPIIVY